MFDIDFISDLSKEVFSGHATVLVYASKIVAALVFLVASAQKIMKNYATSGSSKTGQESGFGPYDILRILGILILIAFIPEILQLMDDVLNGVFSLFLDDMGTELTIQKMDDIPVALSTEEDSVLNSVLQTLLEIKSYISPMGWLTKGIIGIAYYVDILIFLMFLGKRFFVLGVIKILSPLFVAFAVFPNYRELIYNIVKVYVRTFITIIPLLLVNVFANEFYVRFMEYMTDSATKIGTMLIAGETIRAVAVLGLIWLKIKLFRQSSEIVKSLWP